MSSSEGNAKSSFFSSLAKAFTPSIVSQMFTKSGDANNPSRITGVEPVTYRPLDTFSTLTSQPQVYDFNQQPSTTTNNIDHVNLNGKRPRNIEEQHDSMANGISDGGVEIITTSGTSKRRTSVKTFNHQFQPVSKKARHTNLLSHDFVYPKLDKSLPMTTNNSTQPIDNSTFAHQSLIGTSYPMRPPSVASSTTSSQHGSVSLRRRHTMNVRPGAGSLTSQTKKILQQLDELSDSPLRNMRRLGGVTVRDAFDCDVVPGGGSTRGRLQGPPLSSFSSPTRATVLPRIMGIHRSQTTQPYLMTARAQEASSSRPNSSLSARIQRDFASPGGKMKSVNKFSARQITQDQPEFMSQDDPLLHAASVSCLPGAPESGFLNMQSSSESMKFSFSQPIAMDNLNADQLVLPSPITIVEPLPKASQINKGKWTCQMCFISNTSDKCAACGTNKEPVAKKWSCNTCFVSNDASTSKCIACESSKGGDDSSAAPTPAFKATQFNVPKSTMSKFGIKTKDATVAPAKKWSCSMCFVQNEATSSKCVACETSKDGQSADSATTGFKPTLFNHAPQSTTSFGLKPVEQTSSGKDWYCQECFSKNDSSKEKCAACESPKDGKSSSATSSTTFKPTSFTGTSTSKFGINTDAKSTDAVASASFGISNATNGPSTNISSDKPVVFSSGFFDKPKWNCTECAKANEIGVDVCVTCKNSRNEQAYNTNSKQASPLMQVGPDWNCTTCFVSNSSKDKQCCACQSVKPGNKYKAVSFGLGKVNSADTNKKAISLTKFGANKNSNSAAIDPAPLIGLQTILPQTKADSPKPPPVFTVPSFDKTAAPEKAPTTIVFGAGFGSKDETNSKKKLDEFNALSKTSDAPKLPAFVLPTAESKDKPVVPIFGQAKDKDTSTGAGQGMFKFGGTNNSTVDAPKTAISFGLPSASTSFGAMSADMTTSASTVAFTAPPVASVAPTSSGTLLFSFGKTADSSNSGVKPAPEGVKPFQFGSTSKPAESTFTAAPPGASLFGGSMSQPTSTQLPKAGVDFASASQPLFGATKKDSATVAPTAGVFGNFGAKPDVTAPGANSLFGSATNNGATNSTGGSLFGKRTASTMNEQPPQVKAAFSFGQPSNSQTQPSGFGTSVVTQGAAMNAPATTGFNFGQSNANSAVTNGGSAFQFGSAASSAPAAPAFANATNGQTEPNKGGFNFGAPAARASGGAPSSAVFAFGNVAPAAPKIDFGAPNDNNAAPFQFSAQATAPANPFAATAAPPGRPVVKARRRTIRR